MAHYTKGSLILYSETLKTQHFMLIVFFIGPMADFVKFNISTQETTINHKDTFSSDATVTSAIFKKTGLVSGHLNEYQNKVA